jgi:hypothetical protein
MARLPARSSGRNRGLMGPSREIEDICDRMGQLVNVALGGTAALAGPGAFESRAMLLGDVDPEGVVAPLPDGVLTVTVPKSEAARPHEIEVSDN